MPAILDEQKRLRDDAISAFPQPGSDNVLECRNICKTFPGVLALDHVNLSVIRGEIHALVGQNGAGKSTLVKILTGVYTLDEGQILVDGQETRITSPQDAESHGIAIIHQDHQLVAQFDVTRNIFLGHEYVGRAGLLNLAEMRTATAEVLKIVGANFGPDALIRDLSVAQREQVAIAAALLRKPRILILDEPTASLSSNEVNRLFEIIRNLRTQGVTIIYISHHLDEVFQLVDRITVLRDGKVAGTMAIGDTSRAAIIRLMVGRDLRQLYPKEELPIGPAVLEIRNLSQGDALHGASLTLRQGEILGVAGLVGAGRTNMALAVFGALNRTSGEVYLAGQKSDPRSPRAAKRQGLALIPEDRRSEGLITDMSVRENLTLPNLSAWTTMGVLKLRQERSVAADLVKKLQIATPNLNQLARNLSGGNQQKVVIGRWLTGNAKVFIFDEPTTGVDVGAKVEIYKQMTDLARRGAAVLFISSDFEELIGMSDRIAVMLKGKVIKCFERGEVNLHDLLYWATGGDNNNNGSSHDSADATKSDRPEQMAQPQPLNSRAGRLSQFQLGKLLSQWGTAVGMLLALLVIGLSAPAFFAPGNLFDVLKQGSILTFIALGLTAVLIAGGFDMSAGAVSQFTSNFAAGTIIQGLGTGVAVIAGSVAGLIAGIVNGLLVILFRMPPFVATLGTMFVVMGITLLYNGGQALTLYDQPVFFFLGQGYIGPLPFVLVILMLMVATLQTFFKRTRTGLHMYAVGENLAAAKLRGISQRRALLQSFAIGGTVLGFAGVILASYSYGASALATGMDFLISALASAFLGSTLSRTGELDMIGTTIAAMFLASLSNGLILMGVSNLALPGIQGSILILSILLGVVHKREIGQVTIF
ncbi:MAG: ATP-binding cassette domain-containing protein [Anaerolineae bacterium]|nr:ATP-binding cassette domain-containing protein [Anaerolineae bacterium]